MRRLPVVAAGLSVLAFACSGGAGSKPSAEQGPPISLQGTTNNYGSLSASSETEVVFGDFFFAPTFIKAKPGEKFTIDLHNEGTEAHTFTSNALGNIDETVAPGGRARVTVTASAGGAAVFYCRFHQSQGMQGAVYIG